MGVSAYQLEEDEVKIDNLLNKVLHASKIIKELNNQIGSVKNTDLFDKDYVLERSKKIDILMQTTINLVTLADDIDVTDETITKDLKIGLKKSLNDAITTIKKAHTFLEQESNSNNK